MASGTRPRDGLPANAPGYPQATPFMNVPNVPGQSPSSGEYFTGTPWGGASTRNGDHPDYGVIYPQLPGSSRPQLGYRTSARSPPLPRSPRPTAYQPYSVQPAYAARPPYASNDPHQQNPVTVLATGSQYQGSTFVRDTFGRPYYQQWTCNYTVISSPASTILQLPGQPQRFNLTNEHHLSPRMPDAQPYFGGRGRRRALIIGINYIFHPDPNFRLRYCVEDAYAVASFLHDNMRFAREDIRIMTDEFSPWYLPTKDNILREMAALVHDAQPHDSFFIYFSGHAVQVKDLDGDESDGLDECICAMDYLGDDPNPNPDTQGLIVDDIMHEVMVRRLPIGCRLTAIFDSCNSGTLLDLPYLYNAHGVVKEFRHQNRLKILRQKASYADVISLGATKDGRKALETKRGGALRRAFIECLTTFRNGLTYRELIQYLREDMINRNIPQRPLLSSSHEIDTNLPFVI